MPSRHKRAAKEPEQPHEHCAASGFSWTLAYPERGAALGSKKPQACITSDGHDPVRLPVAVARAIEAVEDEPGSFAELLFVFKEKSAACAFQRVADMVSRREYSSKEAYDRLRRDGYSTFACESAVSRARELRIINDDRFAESFICNKLACGWGPVRLERELAQRGITLQDVEGWPEEFMDGEDVTQRAADLLASKRVPEKNAYPKLVRFLASRGYPLSVCKEAVSARLNEEEADI